MLSWAAAGLAASPERPGPLCLLSRQTPWISWGLGMSLVRPSGSEGRSGLEDRGTASLQSFAPLGSWIPFIPQGRRRWRWGDGCTRCPSGSECLSSGGGLALGRRWGVEVFAPEHRAAPGAPRAGSPCHLPFCISTLLSHQVPTACERSPSL